LVPTHLRAEFHDTAIQVFQSGPPERCGDPTTALVLSGGGAWGLMQVGVIRALEETGTRIDMTVGTSMGGIIGSLWTKGYSYEEIYDLVMGLPLDKIFSGYSPQLPPPLDSLPVQVILKQERGGPLAPDLPVADGRWAEQMMHEALDTGDPETPLDFSDLAIPLHLVATDLAKSQPAVLSRGDVAKAVMASAAIPVVFDPVEIQGVELVDGGLSDNIPVATARSLGAGRVIVADATAKLDLKGKHLDSPTELISILIMILFRQDEPDLKPGDVLIRPDLEEHAKLGFSRKERRILIQKGYEAALEALQAADTLQHGPPTPTRGDEGPDTDSKDFGPNAVCEGRKLRRSMVEGEPANLEPALPTDAEAPAESATHRPPRLKSRKKPPSLPQDLAQASRFVGAGFGYQHDLGASARVGLVDTELLNDRAVFAGVLRVGNFANQIELSLRGGTDLFSRTVPVLNTSLAHLQFPQYDLEGESLETRDITSFKGFLGPERRFRNGWILTAGLRFDEWIDPDGSGTRSAFGGELSLHYRRPQSVHLVLEGTLSDRYSRAAAEGQWTGKVGTVLLTPTLRLGWGESLPYLFTFPLGGVPGFPGLHLGEKRGDREAFFSLGAEQKLLGPVHFRLELASGIGGEQGSGVASNEVLYGGRAGLVLRTILGRLDLGYGWAKSGRSTLYLSIREP